ncbi:MAG: helix-turn-helix domain-containing protein [Azoarcus sp.]|jgi:transcriptional regulator with XRE-family HTH domain|nr:helix-turn-helix domain-containing protein [Azoarcus sp.]
MSTFGERLRAERERFGLTQTQLGLAGGVQKQAQLKYEKDERSPDAAYLSAIASIGVDVLYILTGARHVNVATSPTELAYLRNCRALPTMEAMQAGLDILVAFRKAYGVKLPGTEQD